MSNKILVADDDRLLRGLLEHKLAVAGFEVDIAEDGGAALELARTMKYDLMVLDAMMPVMDGFEVLRRLKNDPDTASLPVVMLTARRGEHDVLDALERGAAEYLTKPFIPDELVLRIRKRIKDERARLDVSDLQQEVPTERFA
ncbi:MULTISPECIES: response regulator [unclassified Hyphomonas]|jgi:DNA-binding response OmpR family regulator|uniref:Phosphate regulon transcriptional regulatory protein PhoB (SphR) n=1 Tax=hydrothermal vent metagenome TaxID=652676 RepID=A0A160U1R5_9ZZZZ|nr:MULTISPECIES: response regulator [unclassified Hyphomonas]MAN89970.1 response regulator [Hyphomonadaceae bacterium]MAA80875.1 response regulator [Hyphomonas sp.]MAL44879.1 response regulator [Hyphomonas sp.]MDF1805161.1 response regulator [Hyphomonas sp.]QSR23719.1 response regulator [Hyphomonas sp. KY3]|tara:strand:+ start:6000 stop:6428 length:429 start_codon:yes stop_codon:yes gene_type:complete